MRYRYVLRRLMRSPGFSAIAVVTLALGIGANTAIFSVIEGVLLKPLPFPHSEELIGVWHTATLINLPELNMAPFLYFTYRDQNRTLTDIGVWDTGSASVTGLAEPEQIDTLQVTDATLPLLGIPPALGRWFSRKDDSPGSPETVILMYGYWQSRFGGDRSVVGRRVMVDGRAREIIGVIPERFHFLDFKPSLITPIQFDRSKIFLGSFSCQSLARLKPGVTMAQASADVARMIPIALRSFPPFPGFSRKMFEDAHIGPNLHPLKQDVTGSIGGTLWLLMGTIGMVLLIACANVANLLLVRADGRQQELAIRAALGAGWKAIARELILESLTLAAFGGLAGLGLAYGALRLLVRIGPAHLPRLAEISIDGWVLLFTLAVSLAAGLLFGAIPVLKHAGPNLSGGLRGGGRTSSQSRERHRARSALVVVQVALALVLLISSGLMIRSFQALRNVQPGFTQPERVETLRISIPQAQVKDETAVVRMEQDILQKIAAIPGVESAALASTIPMDASGWHDPIYPEDHPYADGHLPPLRRYRFVSPGLLNATGNRLVAGRDFTWTEVYDKRPVAMVSENLARELWRTPQAALGKRVRESSKNPWHEVIGVVEDEHDDGLDQKAGSTVFWPVLIDKFAGDPGLRLALAVLRDSQRPHRHGGLSERDPAGRLVGESEPAAGQRADAAPDLRQVPGAHFVHPGDAGDRRRHGAAAGHGGDLRRDLVLGGAAHARDRHPHGAGRPARRTDAPVPAPRIAPGADRRGLRPGCGRRPDAAHGEAAVRSQAGRSGNVCRGGGLSDRRRAGGQLSAGLAY